MWHDSAVAVKVIQVSARRPTSAPGPGGADGADGAAVGAELARHEYESWLNANLRHPHIVQLFTSFTVALEAPTARGGVPHAVGASGDGGPGDDHSAGAAAAADGVAGVWEGTLDGRGGPLTCWKTYLIMELCDMGTMQVRMGPHAD